MKDIKHGDTVAVFGCGPVGQFVITSAKLLGAGRIFAVDTIESRLDTAWEQGAEIVNFNKEDPVEAIHRLTGNIGVDRCIDAVGVDAFKSVHISGILNRSGRAVARARRSCHGPGSADQ